MSASSPLNPGGSGVPQSDALDRELRRYGRYAGDHVDRYRWAAAHPTGGRWLDVGCGHGFGAILLGRACTDYVGVDIDAPAIEWAQRVIAPRRPSTRYLFADRPPAGEQFDAVCCFEVLEHVSDPAGLLRRLVGSCRAGGWVFLSTPNGTLSAGRPEWFMSPYHLEEYTLPEFANLVGPVLGRGGEFDLQRRWDGFDWVAPAVRARLGEKRAPTGGGSGGRAAGTPPALRTAHAAVRRVPSPPALWHRVRANDPTRERWAASHLLWAGRVSAETLDR